jgi:uncharacterized membrane protein YphA (DoxX/SURF4 family)
MLGVVASVVLGGWLLIAGVMKLLNLRWQERERELGVPQWLLTIIAPLEIVLGACIAAQFLRPLLAWAAMAMMLGFTVLLLVQWDERSGRPCNCFGVFSKRPVSKLTIIRNITAIIFALVAAFF